MELRELLQLARNEEMVFDMESVLNTNRIENPLFCGKYCINKSTAETALSILMGEKIYIL